MSEDKIIREVKTKKLEDLIDIQYFEQNSREASTKRFRIPKWQRYPSWKTHQKVALVDSIMKDYPIHAIIMTRHVQNGRGFFYIQDGQTRMSALQDYLMDKFKWPEEDSGLRPRLYSELSEAEKATFRYYQISVTEIEIPNADEMKIASDMFGRLNSGKSLTPNEKYNNRQDTQVMSFIYELIADARFKQSFKLFLQPIGNTARADKPRTMFPNLGNMVSLILYISSDGRDGTTLNPAYEANAFRLEGLTETNKEEVRRFLVEYFKIIQDARVGNRSRINKQPFTSVSGALGMIAHDWLLGKRALREYTGEWLSPNRHVMLWYAAQIIHDKNYNKSIFAAAMGIDISRWQQCYNEKRYSLVFEAYTRAHVDN